MIRITFHNNTLNVFISKNEKLTLPRIKKIIRVGDRISNKYLTQVKINNLSHLNKTTLRFTEKVLEKYDNLSIEM